MVDLDEFDGQPIFFDCSECHGERRRSRKSPGSRNCKHYSCKGVRKRGREEQLPVAEQPVAAAPTTCFKVKEVLGMSVCLQLDPDERRVGRHADDDDYQLQVRGGFGKHEGEDDMDLIPDTRWVSLAELVTNDVDAAALAALETLTKKLPKALKAAAKRIRQRVHEREE